MAIIYRYERFNDAVYRYPNGSPEGQLMLKHQWLYSEASIGLFWNKMSQTITEREALQIAGMNGMSNAEFFTDDYVWNIKTVERI
jgi:hypothetical protein